MDGNYALNELEGKGMTVFQLWTQELRGEKDTLNKEKPNDKKHISLLVRLLTLN